MMKILHFYPKADDMITQYVTMLSSAMGSYADVQTSHSLYSFRKTLKKQKPDIVHIHGCWHLSIAIATREAINNGARVVLSPHGQLEPWIIHRKYWQEKLPKMLLFQKRTVKSAYALISMGRMEEGCLLRMKINPRIETVLNALITESITESDMARKIYDIYQKVLDSNVVELMEDKTYDALSALIKVGLTGDTHWLTNEEYNTCKDIDDNEWRKILIYAYREKISETIDRGIANLYLSHPDIQPASIPCYLPAKYIEPDSLAKALGNIQDNPTDYILSAIKALHKLTLARKLSISNIIEFAYQLRTSEINEDKAQETLAEKHLIKFTRRLMQVLADSTGLEEGFMIVSPLNDRKTYRIKTLIDKHLKI